MIQPRNCFFTNLMGLKRFKFFHLFAIHLNSQRPSALTKASGNLLHMTVNEVLLRRCFSLNPVLTRLGKTIKEKVIRHQESPQLSIYNTTIHNVSFGQVFRFKAIVHIPVLCEDVLARRGRITNGSQHIRFAYSCVREKLIWSNQDHYCFV